MTLNSVRLLLAAGIVAVLVSCQTPAEVADEMPENPAVQENVSDSASGIASTPGISVEAARDSVASSYGNPILQVQTNAFSPNGDGYRDSLEFFASVPDAEGLVRWELTLLTEGHSEVLRYQGQQLVPGRFTWDGNDLNARPVRDGYYYGRLTVHYEDGAFRTAHSSRFLLWREGPRARIVLPRRLFSPDGDGVDDTITVALNVEDPESIVSYQVTLYDSMDSVFASYAGSGAPPAEFTWDGSNDQGETVESAEDYRLELRMRDELGNISIINESIGVDILVYRVGDTLRIRTNAISFLPYSDNYIDVSPDERAKNLATLDRLAEVLQKFPGYRIAIEGHAVQVFWDDPVRGETEQREVLIPLSSARADAVRLALAARGVQSARMTTLGVGAARPLVPFSDLENRWKNRRVEFILVR